MRKPTDILIDEIVIHILDPAGRFIPSERPITLSDNAKLHNFFTNHISTCLAAPSAKASRFRNMNPKLPSGLCEAMLQGETDLVTGAQELSGQLYDILANDRRISPGDLAICFYRASNYPDQRFLAMLKINPSEVFQHRIRDVNNARYIDFMPATQPMFAKKETLQKAVFIKQRTEDSYYDMLLIDRQTPDVADFFSKTFLDVEDAFDDRENTTLFYNSLIHSHNKLRPLLTPEENTVVDSAIRDAISGESIHVDSMIKRLPLPDDVREQFHENLDDRLPDHVIKLDKTTSTRLLKWHRFRGDHGLKVEVQRDVWDSVVQGVEHIADDPGSSEPYYKITIHTKRWVEIK
jgi:hypothetical protein